MYQIKNLFYWLILSAMMVLTSSSCKKFLDIPPPQTKAETSKIFSSEEGALSAIAGLYNRMPLIRYYLMDSGPTIFGALSADELNNTSSTSLLEFQNNALTSAENININGLWWPGYRTIYQANAIMEGLEHSDAISDSLKKQLRGEALFVRAINYFYLVNLFGDVPLIINTSYEENQLKPRTAVAEVYEQIIDDLQEAKDLLSTTYPSSGRARANKWAAVSMLARVYLYLQQWDKAESEASGVIASGNYSLVTNLNNVFLMTSNESIWYLSKNNSNTSEGMLFIPLTSTVRPSFIITSYLMDAFETGDARKNSWTKANIAGGVTYFYPYKYKIRSSTTITESVVVLRFAELYLIRAEARAQQGKILESINDLNMIRSRAGLPGTTANDKPGMLAAIEAERRVELFTEWGHRWLDLKRTGRADAVLSPIKGPEWQPTDVLYPLPKYDLRVNPFLIQNPGY